MKITKEVWSLGVLNKVEEFRDISSAVEDATKSDQRLSELVARLVEVLYDDRARLKHEAVSYILGHDYEVIE